MNIEMSICGQFGEWGILDIDWSLALGQQC